MFSRGDHARFIGFAAFVYGVVVLVNWFFPGRSLPRDAVAFLFLLALVFLARYGADLIPEKYRWE